MGIVIECCLYAIIIVVIYLPVPLLDEGEFVGFVTSVVGPVRPAAVGEVDNLNCLDE